MLKFKRKYPIIRRRSAKEPGIEFPQEIVKKADRIVR